MKKPIANFAEARELHRAGELEQAKKRYLAILRKNPAEIEALHWLGILFIQQENFPDAIHYLELANQKKPDDITLQLHLANALKMQGLYTQATKILLQITQHSPDYAPAFNNLGTTLYAQSKLAEAERNLRHAVDLQPDYVDAFYNLGLTLTKQLRYADAIEIYRKLLKIAPDHFAARFHLACALMQEEKYSAAETEFLSVEESHPYHFETQTNLATCYLKLGSLTQAKVHYAKALELMPKDTQILFNLGVINMQLDQPDSAIQSYQRTLQVEPDSFAAHNNLAVAFLAKQRPDFALHHFREALRLQPNNQSIAYTVATLAQNQHFQAAPPDYVKSLFDAYADHYEPHLLNALDYKIPELLKDALLKKVKLVPASLNVLDLGCGTGLCGVPFKPFAKNLTGVDLSEKMLAVAAQKKIYDELVTGELVDFLILKKASYDLIIAGDVLMYLGDLAKIFQLISVALNVGGFFIFNTEICEGEKYKMNQSGRFTHQKEYLDLLVKENGLKVINYQRQVTRMQNNEPVLGHVYVLTK